MLGFLHIMQVAKFLKVRGVVRLPPPHIDELVSWIAARDFCQHFARPTEHAATFQLASDMPLRIGRRDSICRVCRQFAGRTAGSAGLGPLPIWYWHPACSLYVGRTLLIGNGPMRSIVHPENKLVHVVNYLYGGIVSDPAVAHRLQSAIVD